MMIERYQPKQFVENHKNTCRYCHRTPALWQFVGSEKVCAHCGTRVFDSGSYTAVRAKSPGR